MTRIQDSIDRIKNRYDGDNDLPQGQPLVTWTDYELLLLIELLIKRIDTLEEKVGENAGS